MSDLIKILLVDDNEDDFIITQHTIKKITQRNYQLEWVNSFSTAKETIARRAHDIYLIDYLLGINSGLDLIKTATKSGHNGPFILLTGQGDLEIDEQAMEAGASDYLVKGKINPFDLERSIRYGIQSYKHHEEIRKLNGELEERVKQRTAELFNAIKKLEETNENQKRAQEEVRKALEKEKELNELKSRFVTIASHEFRTPLTTVLSAASLIVKHSQTNDHEKALVNVDRIKSCVSSLKGILNDFLSLSRLEESSIANNPVEFNLKDFILEVKENMVSMIKREHTMIYRHQGTEVINLDKEIMRGILTNLISNALKYSEKGTIEIHSEVMDEKIFLSVKDEGIGIPEGDKNFLFGRFFRAKDTGNIQGTGLGLNIVKRYVEIYNGKIMFESKEGEGTLFKIEIPIQHPL